MISSQVIINCIDEASRISKMAFLVTDTDGKRIAGSLSDEGIDENVIKGFLAGSEECLATGDKLLVRIDCEDEPVYVLAAEKGDNAIVCAQLVAAQLRNLTVAYRDKVDRDSFYQNILLDNILPVDVFKRAAKLHIDTAQRRCVFVIEPVTDKENNLMEMVRELFYSEAGDHVTAVDENRVIVIRALEEGDGEEELLETAEMLVDMAGSEALSDVRVAYGTIAEDIKSVSKSYKEARMALEVSRIFYPLKRTIEYGNLGVGRLIYQLPVNLCQLFIKEIFGEKVPDEIDEEMLTTVNKFFENSLNVSETSRQLFIHRNTLIYRIEKLQKATGLDIRVFDDALTLKIALMVVNYMKYAEKEGS